MVEQQMKNDRSDVVANTDDADDNVSVMSSTSNTSAFTTQTGASTRSRLDEIRAKRLAFQKKFKKSSLALGGKFKSDKGKESKDAHVSSSASVPDVIAASPAKRELKKKKKKKKKQPKAEPAEPTEPSEPQFVPASMTAPPQKCRIEQLSSELEQLKATAAIMTESLLKKDLEVVSLQGSLREYGHREEADKPLYEETKFELPTGVNCYSPPMGEIGITTSESTFDDMTVLTERTTQEELQSLCDELELFKSLCDRRSGDMELAMEEIKGLEKRHPLLVRKYGYSKKSNEDRYKYLQDKIGLREHQNRMKEMQLRKEEKERLNANNFGIFGNLNKRYRSDHHVEPIQEEEEDFDMFAGGQSRGDRRRAFL